MWDISDEELVKAKCAKIFIPLIYAEIVAQIVHKWGIDEATEKLKAFGRRIASGILKVWSPKNISSIKDIAQESYKYLLKQKPPIEVQKDGRAIVLKDSDCVLCWNVQASGLNYCTPYGSLLENIINYCRTKNPKLPKIWVETTKSRAMGFDYCEHVIHIKEE